jgi:hypothetical protein
MTQIHISDHDLEPYHLGMVTAEGELAVLEEHLSCCGPCVDHAEKTQDYVDAVRAAAYDYVPDELPLERGASG